MLGLPDWQPVTLGRVTKEEQKALIGEVVHQPIEVRQLRECLNLRKGDYVSGLMSLGFRGLARQFNDLLHGAHDRNALAQPSQKLPRVGRILIECIM